ncbi:hypothetical protein U5B43_02145 [Campylobacter sp. 9BO]|uniref:hypothetical protein n=1 Tax=Campylobacter sp. 9BO TaxID=3424759 RepID=UPI003D3596D9
MSKILALFLMLAAFCFAAPPVFNSTHTFELKKDEWARVWVTEKATQQRDSFDFRWTLFDATNIIVQSFFRRYPKHLTLALDNKRASFLQKLVPDFTMPPTDSAQLLLTFIDFKDKKAKFKVDIIDGANRVDVEFVDPPKKGINATN